MVPVLSILATFFYAKPNDLYKLITTPRLKGCIKDLHAALDAKDSNKQNVAAAIDPLLLTLFTTQCPCHWSRHE